MRQDYLTSKLNQGDDTVLGELSLVKLHISSWYQIESENIILMSRSKDISLNEKVSVYHHDLHLQFRKKTPPFSSLRLQAGS